MTFKSSPLILACGICLCLQASRAFAAGPAAYTTITNTIDIMGAVQSAQENNGGGYGGQIVYSRNGEGRGMPGSKRSDVERRPTSPDISNASETPQLPLVNFQGSPSVPGNPDMVARGSGSPPFAYVATSSGPSSITISSSGPDVRTISYSAPGGVFITHGYPGSSYVLSAFRPAQTPENFFTAKTTIPEISASSFSSSSSSGLRNYPGAGFGLPERRYSLNSGPGSRVLISGGPDSSSIISLVAAGASAATAAHGYAGHPAYAAAYRNLQAAKHVIDGISSAVSRAVNINLAGIGEAE